MGQLIGVLGPNDRIRHFRIVTYPQRQAYTAPNGYVKQLFLITYHAVDLSHREIPVCPLVIIGHFIFIKFIFV